MQFSSFSWKSVREKRHIHKKMEKQIKEFVAEKIVYFETQEKLDKLYQLVVIDSWGDYIPFNPDEEEKGIE